MYRFYKIKIMGCIFLILFSGCSFGKKEKIIDEKEFEQMTSGKIKGASCVVNLFPKSVKDVERRVEFAIADAQKGLDNVLKIEETKRTFENTVRVLDTIEFKFGMVRESIHISEMVNPDSDIIAACHAGQLKMREFAVDAFLNKNLYKAFKAYVDGNMKNEKLTVEEQFLIKESTKDFVRGGFNLPDEEFEKVKKIKKELSKLSLQFDANINQDQSKIVVQEDGLNGLEDHFIQSLEKTKEGDYILGCDYPTYFEVMENCKIEDTRKRLYFAFQNRAYPQNIDLLNQIIAKRDELAKTLKFDSYAHLDLDSEMAKKPEIAEDFLTKLVEKSLKKADEEFAEITRELPEEIKLDENSKLSPWDGTYLSCWYKKKNFDVDERKIAEYFTVEHTVNKIFEIYQKFLGLKFEPVQTNDLWHKDAQMIQVTDAQTNELRGYLLLDLYPRKNKYSHACMDDIVKTIKYKLPDSDDDEITPAVIIVIANFPKATQDRPALLKHNDVETFFHEFGHAMHGMLGRTELAAFAGTSVKTDFVEVPSQMFEEWMWDKEIIKDVSKHYQTGESLPDELIDKKIELKKFGTGSFVTRQCWLSFLALQCFDAGDNKDVQEIKKSLHEKYIRHTRFEPDAYFQASFGHLTGYGAKYYSYMWSKVFALDLFYEIKKYGLLDSKIGAKLIDKVLGKGGSVEPDILLKDFLGREPNQKAFLRDLGIV